MKFLMLIKHAEGAPGLEHPESLYAAMGKFVEESFKSGILKDTAGLKRTEHGYRIKSKGGKLTRTDGPFAESKEQMGGFWVINVPDMDSALEWARKATVACDGPVEVRPFQGE